MRNHSSMSDFCLRQANRVSLGGLCDFSLFFLSCGNWWELAAPEAPSKFHNKKTVIDRHSGCSKSILRTGWCPEVDWPGKVPTLPSSTTQAEYSEVAAAVHPNERKGGNWVPTGEGRHKFKTENNIKCIILRMQNIKGNHLEIKTCNNPHLSVTQLAAWLISGLSPWALLHRIISAFSVLFNTDQLLLERLRNTSVIFQGIRSLEYLIYLKVKKNQHRTSWILEISKHILK